MSHNESDIRASLERSPQVREAVARLLATLGEARECGVYSFTDTCDYEHTVETRFAKYQQAVDFEQQITAAGKALDKWIMKESGEDDMDAERTVAVQKAIGALNALLLIANGVGWSRYQQLETDTRGIVTERMAQRILDTLQQPPATEDSRLAAIARGIAAFIEVYELPLSGASAFDYWSMKGKVGGLLNEASSDSFMECMRQLALWKAGQQAAEAAEAAPVDALATGNGDGGYSDYAAALRKIEDCILALTICADDQRWQELQVSSEHREAIADRYENAAHDNLKTLVSLYATARERIAELEAEVARLQGERDGAVRLVDYYIDLVR